MSMKEKALLIKEDFDQLFDAGKQNVISNSKYIEKQANGKFIRLDDVSEVAHKVVVKADTPTEVKVYGKNIFDGQLEGGSIDSNTGNNLNTSTSTRSINYIPIIPNTTYTISREITGKNIRTRFYDKNKTYIGYGFSAVNTPMTFVSKEDYAFLRLELVGGTVDEKVQVEFDSATEYEPYTEQTITATPNGAEVASMCPIMNFLADNDVTVDYYGSYGRQAQRLEWWGKYLGYKETNRQAKYLYMAFGGYAWDDTTFDPPFDIYSSNSSSMFMNSYVQDVRGILERNNVRIIFSDDPIHNQHYSVFQNSKIKYLPYLKLPYGGSCYGWFTNCTQLIEVDGYECLEKHAFETSSGAQKTFQGCTNLEHIIFHGTIANNINLQWCTKLDLESLISLVSCLKTFTPSDSGYKTKTVTLSAESWALLDTYVYENMPEWSDAQDWVGGWYGWNFA